MALLIALYGCVVFLSAFLLFLIEPMVAKQLLPLLGGSSAVWTTCLVFFQLTLLAGYLYAFLVVRKLQPRTQAMTHVCVLLLAFTLTGVHPRPDAAMATWHPMFSLFWWLTAAIGLPFLALSATSPLLQAWLPRIMRMRGEGGAGAFRIFALSNAGSLLALVTYPMLIEPYITLQHQAAAWAAAFFVFAVLCGSIAWQGRSAPEIRAGAPVEPLRRPWMIFLLPAGGAMLLCGFTSYLSQNVAAIPLLWILPLIAYLMSFIVAFSGMSGYSRSIVVRMLMFALGVVCYMTYDIGYSLPLQLAVPIFCVALFVACWFCHEELYALRPRAGDPTRFYLLLAAGSAVGSLLVGVGAPLIYKANYELVTSLVAVALLALAVVWAQGFPMRLVWMFMTGALLWVISVQVRAYHQDSLAQVRSFYGALRVTETHLPPQAGTARTLYHGNIRHGTQLFGNGLRKVPTTYYAHNSGVGLALDNCCADAPRKVGIVGLGAGTLAAYGRPGDEFDFYELDPLIVRLSKAWFTYTRESKARVNIVLGDARLSIAREVGAPFDVLILDAFTGDAVPVHLLTAQAIALYRSKLKPDGILAFHISSQYIDLEPLLALEAEHAGLRAYAVHASEYPPTGEYSSDWVLMSASQRFFDQPLVAPRMHTLEREPTARLWTDDYNSLLPLLKWKGMASAFSH